MKALSRLLFAAVLAGSACLPPYPEVSLADDPTTDWDGDGYTERDGDCDDEDASLSPVTEWRVDADGDGYGDDSTIVVSCRAPAGAVAEGGDCDDTDRGVHPAATERCNETDDDCDELVDDADPDVVDARVWYVDADGDQWGSDEPVLGCVRPPNSAAASGDCDDTRADVYPGAPEICDGVDDDCDELVDDEDSQVDRAPVWYTDADGDGHGSPVDPTVTACEAPEGFADTPDDCDDADPFRSPDARELCDGMDNDCDELIDGADPDVVGATEVYLDFDNDGYGDPANPRLACEERIGWVEVGGDCDDGDASVNPDAAEVCNGNDDDCDEQVDEGCR